MTHEHSKKSAPPLAGEGMRKNLEHHQYTTLHQRPIDRVLDAIRAHGGRVNQSNTRCMCTCPAHNDRTPSLSIKQGDDGRVLLKCFAGCTPEQVVQSLGMEMGDLFSESGTASSRSYRPEKPRSSSGSSNKSSHDDGFEQLDDAIRVYIRKFGKIDHRWDYNDSQGNLVGVVLRWDQEMRKVVRPVSLINGRWQLKVMPAPRPLYRLPQVLSSDGPVVVCEGEKAADAALQCGYEATTSSGGSNAAMLTDWSVLRGRQVIIIPDLGEAGDAYARVVLSKCFDVSACSVRVLDLRTSWPDLPANGDLADVLELEADDFSAIRGKLETIIEDADEALPQLGQKRPESTGRNGMLPMPIHLMPEPVRSYVTEGARAIECDPAFIALPVLSMLAAAIGNTHVIRLKRNWHEPCIIWTCIIGKSGAAKSPALELATDPLRSIQNRQISEHEQALRKWRKHRKNTGVDSDTPRCERCVLDDTTIEGALQVMSQNPRGLLQVRDELAEWFDFDRYSSSKGPSGSSRWLGLFGGRTLQIDRRTEEPIHIRRVGMSITGGIQPGILRRVLKSAFMENGLAARMLFANPPCLPRRWNDADLSPESEIRMRSLVERLYQHQMNSAAPDASEQDPKPHEIGLTPGAREHFKAFYNEHHGAIEDEEDHVRASCVKLVAYCARFALIIHLVREAAGDPTLENPVRVDASSMYSAIGLVHWFKHESIRVYSMISMDEEQADDQAAIDWISKHGGAVTINRFSRGLKRYNRSDLAKAKLLELEKKGYGRFQAKPPNGRTQEFVIDAQYITNTHTASSCPQVSVNNGDDSGASGRYPVPFNGKGQ